MVTEKTSEPAVPLSIDEQDKAFRPHQVPQVRLSEVTNSLVAAGFAVQLMGTPEEEVLVTGVSMDSRTVQPGDLYIAVPGAHHHGAEYWADAEASGAVGVLTDQEGAETLKKADSAEKTLIVVDSVRDALGWAARAVYTSNSAHSPVLYGVTGTNGKTTTTYFINSLLEKLGQETGLIGTIEIRAGQTVVPSVYTTPEATQVHALMALMREQNVEAATMEVSSHALSYRRVAGMHYSVSGFTNLTQDHLDLHGSMQEYFDAKALLFTSTMTDTAVITLNGGPETHWGEEMAQAATSHLVTLDLGPVGLNPPQEMCGDWTVEKVKAEGLGHRFTLVHHNDDGEAFSVNTSVALPGTFNVANAALAAVMVFEGYPRAAWDQIRSVLEQPMGSGPFASAVPGRMEIMSQSPAALVDFAHNTDGLAQCLDAVSLAGNKEGKTILVFGATGERDTSKRPIMGRMAASKADIVVVTDDDPHNETPGPIREQVLAGVTSYCEENEKDVTWYNKAPRAAAIDFAVSLARPEDSIVVAGRGHETEQEVAGTLIPLDDRVELREALKRHGYITTDVPSTDSDANGGKINSL